MIGAMQIEAPAKLNLSLRVVRRREDGFHEIDSVMVRLDGLADRMDIEAADEDTFACDAPGVPTDERNLVLAALGQYREATGWRQPLAIRLEKRVPHGAGLGGGSSDAASALMAFNKLAGEPLAVDELIGLGATLGSDIPFFLGAPVARVAGRGEILKAGPELPALPVVLLKPSFGVSTPEAYKRWKDSRELPGINYSAQCLEWGELVNDLERPVFEKHRFLAEMKRWLAGREGVQGSLMSGSGSTMFAVLEEGTPGEAIIEAAREELDPTLWGWSGRILR